MSCGLSAWQLFIDFSSIRELGRYVMNAQLPQTVRNWGINNIQINIHLHWSSYLSYLFHSPKQMYIYKLFFPVVFCPVWNALPIHVVLPHLCVYSKHCRAISKVDLSTKFMFRQFNFFQLIKFIFYVSGLAIMSVGMTWSCIAGRHWRTGRAGL